MPRTTKTKSRPKSSPNGETQKTNLLDMVKDIASLKADKLGWRVAVTIFGAALAFVYVEMSDHKEQIAQLRVEVAVVKANQEQTREIAEEARDVAMEARDVAMENSRKLDMLLMQNEILLGGRNATPSNTPVDAPANAPYTAPITPKPKENYNVPL